MRTKTTAAALAAALAIIIPAVAHADDSTKSKFGKNFETSKVSVSIISRSTVNPGVQRQAVAPQAHQRGGGIAQRITGALQQAVQAPSFDRFPGLCRNVTAGVETACRAIDPDDPDTPTPAGGGAPAQQIDAAVLAQRAANQLTLPRPALATSPQDPVQALVGLETWLWVPEDQWQPLTASAEAGDADVTVSAQPIQSRWDMGEGITTCDNPGRPWRKGLGQDATTPCGYTYKKTSAREAGGKYDISAITRYQISWTCDGDGCDEDSGDLGTLDSPLGTATLQVGERHAVIVN